jgi:hypothetical protein
MIVDEALWLLDVDDFKKMERRLLGSSKVGNVHVCCICWRRHHCGSGCVCRFMCFGRRLNRCCGGRSNPVCVLRWECRWMLLELLLTLTRW